MQYRTIIMSHLPARSISGRLIAAAGALATAGALIAACSIAPAASAAAGASTARDTTAAVCTGAGDLHLRIAGSQYSRAAGITYYTLDFTNTSGSTCSLSGYPYVSMVTRGGSQLGSPAGHGLMTIAPLVVLAPGATAHTTLAYYDSRVGAGRECGPVAKAYELRVFVAGQKRALYAAMGLHACSHVGQEYLSVTQPFHSGNG
jgi:Protein of unknown function (DUF4232)